MKPVRILHVLGALNRGGAETWLLHLLRQTDRSTFQIDFLVHTTEPAAYDAEVLALGSRIFRCPHVGNPIRYAAAFLNILGEFGPFDVIHSHVHLFSGYILSLARLAGVPMRLSHSHSNTRLLEPPPSRLRKVYERAGRRLIASNCTHGIAVSGPAAEDLFGPGWEKDERFHVCHCGIDLAAFQETNSRARVRRQFGFGDNDPVFGHVGRFDRQKNHSFLLDVAAEIVKKVPRAKFLLVGDGPLKTVTETRARSLGLMDSVVFAGVRPDVSDLMRAMDVFLFPSLCEGLPLVMMETQAAALRSVVSYAVPQEAIVNPALVQRVPLSAGVASWERLACEVLNQPPFDRRRAIEIMFASPFSIVRSIRHLSNLYLTGVSRHRDVSVATPMNTRLQDALTAGRRGKDQNA